MSQSLNRNSRYKNGIPSYGSVSKGKKSSLTGSIEEGQPLIPYSPSPSDGSRSSVARRYPKATYEQRELLLLLESEMKFAQNSKFHIVLPQLSKRRVQKLRSKISRVSPSVTLDINGCEGFLFSFLRTTLLFLFITLLVTILILIGIEKWNFGLFNPDDAFNTFIDETLPVMSVALSVISCVGPMIQRLTPFSQEVGSYASPSSLKVAAKEGIEEMVAMIASRVDHVNIKLAGVLRHMRRVSDRALRFQQKIRMVDQEAMEQLDLLNTPYLDAEREIQNAKEEIQAKLLTFEQDISFDVASWVPSYLSSPRKFFKYDMFGHLGLLLFLHLVGTLTVIYIMERKVPKDLQVEFLSNITSFIGKIPYFASLSQRLTPFIVCWISALLLETYLISSFFLVNIYFAKSSCSRTVTIINDLRSVITSHTNWLLLQNGVIFLCHDILEVRMNQLRLKLIALVDHNHMLCSALNLADIDDTSISGEEDDDKVLTNFPFQSPTASTYSYISKQRMTPGSVVSYQQSLDPPEDRPTPMRPAAESPPTSDPEPEE